ncbi:FAD binding domain-containing protein [Colletotrichum lupini]|uniref:FAD binding domain-containing protein n=1 Tax=Colletotrichum lupini TaxID=145971 RepID=A0A9Q8WDQ3_9PEZI|nr:FAD binding domain-containing protein [Colletotrichum lupini]UQC78967.1 FAD binding domain-containing protein [Colletotrichum lupini]
MRLKDFNCVLALLISLGGRENTVGVSGLLLGGALKGGACNFDLVAKFVLKTFPYRNLYGGVMVFPWAQKNAIVQKFVEIIDGNTSGHPEDTGFAAAACLSGGKRISFVVANIEGQSNSTAFAGLEVLPPVVDVRANLPVTSIAAQITSPSGEYQVWSTLTFHNKLGMGCKILSSFDAVIEDIQDQVQDGDDFRIVYLLTPFPTLASNYGGNVLGLNEIHKKNSIVLSIQGILPNMKSVGLSRQRLKEATADIEAYAIATGQLITYLYLNYADQDQRPLATYGEENIRFLKRVAEKYDPGQFFQYSVPGGFRPKDV